MEEELMALCSQQHGAKFSKAGEEGGFLRMEVAADAMVGLLELLFRDNRFWFDFLQCISAEHFPGPGAAICLHYHLESIPHGRRLQLVCRQEIPADGSKPVFPSAGGLWHTAGWHEREAAELFGIHFEGHPDLRNLLLPTDWTGFPMRKDYQPEEKYHGLKIKAEGTAGEDSRP
jgi:NADH-quinone oxidoreductase subunit C